MNFFKKLFKIGQAEANSAIEKFEDPIKMTEQGIRDMKSDLEKSLNSLAEVKALSIRSRNDHETYAAKAQSYQEKAMLLLQKAQAGEIATEEADKLATEALLKKDSTLAQADEAKANSLKFEASVDSLNGTVDSIKNNISKWENELKTLKARVKVSAATKNLNKQMAQLDSSGTVSMLERMKEKVAQEEALAQSYGEIANEGRSVDQEIDNALGDLNKQKAENDLQALKEKMGINKPQEPTN